MTSSTNDRRAGGETPLDAFPGAVRLGLLADREGVEWNATAAGSGGDGISNGVRAQGEAADGPRGPTPRGQAIQAERANDGEALSGHRREPRVDVEGGAFT